jgi:hypothetical protein
LLNGIVPKLDCNSPEKEVLNTTVKFPDSVGVPEIKKQPCWGYVHEQLTLLQTAVIPFGKPSTDVTVIPVILIVFPGGTGTGRVIGNADGSNP